MRGREIGDGQRQGCGRGREPAEVVVGGGGQVLFGKSHRTAAAVADSMRQQSIGHQRDEK